MWDKSVNFLFHKSGNAEMRFHLNQFFSVKLTKVRVFSILVVTNVNRKYIGTSLGTITVFPPIVSAETILF